jgi:hypothetical protein
MLSRDQTQQYHEQGFLTLPGVFTPAELEPVDAYLRANADVTWVDKNDDPLREAHCHFRPLYDLCTTPQLPDAVKALLGHDLALLYCHILSYPTPQGAGFCPGWSVTLTEQNGKLKVARQPISTAAKWSACPAWPQATQRNWD